MDYDPFVYPFIFVFIPMSAHEDSVRRLLERGPLPSRHLIESIGISQPTLSRTLQRMGAEVVRIGKGPSIQYALRDARRGLPEIPVHRGG